MSNYAWQKAYYDRCPWQLQHKREIERTRYVERYNKLCALKAEKGCTVCGQHDARVLEFHHVIGRSHTGRRKVSTYLASSWERVLAEIEDCVVLCANCHALREWSIRYGME